jgi:iron complex transport system substrate-binding protein
MSSGNRSQRLPRLSRLGQWWLGWGVLLLLLAVALTGCRNSPAPNSAIHTQCRRIVSLSPSVTEVLFALDLGSQVVGVTKFCHYPPEARNKPSVGGYVDPDMETLLRLKPDLVIVRQEQTDLVQAVRNLGIPVLGVDHRDTDGILASFAQIGRLCHRETQAQAEVNHLKATVGAIEHKTRTASTRPSVLVVVDRDSHASRIRWAYVAGQDGFYDRMIREAGGKNALPTGRKGFLQVSSEGILRMNPEIIIETLPSIGGVGEAPADAWRQWSGLPQVAAVRNHRVYLFNQDYMVIPGPRYVQVLEQFAQAIHPELDWTHDGTSPPPAQRS